jgi:MFS family permease
MALSAHFGKYGIILTARLVMGMSLELEHVVVFAFASLWFTGKEGGLAFSVIVLMMRLGMVSTDFLSPTLMDHFGKLTWPFGFSFGIYLLATLAALTIIVIDYRNQQRVRKTLKRVDTLEQNYARRH